MKRPPGNPRIAQFGVATRFTSETAPRRKNLGQSVNEWRNEYGQHSREKLQAVLEDPKATVAQLMAVRELLLALDGKECLAAIAQACEFTSGRPKQVNENHEFVHVRRTVIRTNDNAARN